MGIIMGISLLVVLGILISGVTKRNDFSVYASLIGLPILSFLTSFFITQAVRTKNNENKNTKR